MNNREYLFDMFRLYFPTEIENVDTYEVDVTAPYELILTFHDGSVHVFNELNRTIYTVQRDPSGMSEIEWRREFGRRLRRRIAAEGHTQSEFAELVGITQTAISSYINGKTMPGFYIVAKIAKALHCSTDDLIY